MMSVLDKLHASAEDIGVFASMALLFSMFKIVTTPGKMHWKHIVLNLVVGVTMGSLAGVVSLEMGYGDFTSIAITSATTYLSRDILDFLRERKGMASLAKRAAENIVDKATK